MLGLSPRCSGMVVAAALALAGCTGVQNPPPLALTGPPPKPSISASDVIGRWGLGAFHREEDRARTETITKARLHPALRDQPREWRQRDDAHA